MCLSSSERINLLVRDAFIKEDDKKENDKEEEEKEEEETLSHLRRRKYSMDAFLVAKSRLRLRLLRLSSSSSFDFSQRILFWSTRHLSSSSSQKCLCIRRRRRHCVSPLATTKTTTSSTSKGRQQRRVDDDDDAHGHKKRRFMVTTATSSSSKAEKTSFARTIGGDLWTNLGKRHVHSTTRGSQKEEEEEDKDKEEKLHLSEKCERQLRSIFAKEEEKKTALRVGVDGGGCAGFQYTFALVDEKDVDAANDRVFRGALYPEEVKVVCDEVSFAYLKGSTVDYSEEMIRSAFEVVKNPNAEQKCGCGVSFEAKF